VDVTLFVLHFPRESFISCSCPVTNFSFSFRLHKVPPYWSKLYLQLGFCRRIWILNVTSGPQILVMTSRIDLQNLWSLLKKMLLQNRTQEMILNISSVFTAAPCLNRNPVDASGKMFKQERHSVERIPPSVPLTSQSCYR